MWPHLESGAGLDCFCSLPGELGVVDEDANERHEASSVLILYVSRTLAPRLHTDDVEGSPHVLVLAQLLCDPEPVSRTRHRSLYT
jgi:hypothetical protein